jgi:hypothetical protein
MENKEKYLKIEKIVSLAVVVIVLLGITLVAIIGATRRLDGRFYLNGDTSEPHVLEFTKEGVSIDLQRASGGAGGHYVDGDYILGGKRLTIYASGIEMDFIIDDKLTLSGNGGLTDDRTFIKRNKTCICNEYSAQTEENEVPETAEKTIEVDVLETEEITVEAAKRLLEEAMTVLEAALE